MDTFLRSSMTGFSGTGATMVSTTAEEINQEEEDGRSDRERFGPGARCISLS